MLTQKEATKLLRTIAFKDDPTPPKDFHLAKAPKGVRMALLQEEGGEKEEERRSAAAIEIQRQWRGFLTRCRLFALLNEYASVQRIWAGSHASSRYLGSSTPSEQPSALTVKSTSISEVPGKGKSRLKEFYINFCKKAEEKGESSIAFDDFCAHYIQNWWHKVRRKRHPKGAGMAMLTPTKSSPSISKSVSIILSPDIAGVSGIQPSAIVPPPTREDVKGFTEARKANRVKKKRTQPLEKNEAASMIQLAWRRHIDVQVYRYYRDLINFRCRGNPSMMLRCINPKEASLLDAAAGVHIKFRLAGSKFPPNIYYKIFTHRNIVDMCANSPKDYTAAPSKRFAARDVHNRREFGVTEVQRESESEDRKKTGWYQRIENNGWRLVSDRLILRADQDPVTWESSHKKQEFSHSKLQRKEDVEKKKKRKKLDWMKKMYKEGMLQAKGEEIGLNTLVEDATDGLMAQLDRKGPESVDDWEVDELLQWTSGLNFEDYQKSWQEIATSAGSETFIDERLQFKTSKEDPFEFSMEMNTLPSPSPPSPSRVTTAKTRTSSSRRFQGVPVN